MKVQSVTPKQAPAAGVPEQRICKVCGKPFTPRSNGHTQKTCSPECSNENKRRICRAIYQRNRLLEGAPLKGLPVGGSSLSTRARLVPNEIESVTGDPWLDLVYAILAFCYNCGKHMKGQRVCECGWTWDLTEEELEASERRRMPVRRSARAQSDPDG